jgi:hypothetical protein
VSHAGAAQTFGGTFEGGEAASQAVTRDGGGVPGDHAAGAIGLGDGKQLSVSDAAGRTGDRVLRVRACPSVWGAVPADQSGGADAWPAPGAGRPGVKKPAEAGLVERRELDDHKFRSLLGFLRLWWLCHQVSDQGFQFIRGHI